MRSDDFWTGEISKNMLTNETIGFINLMNTETGVNSYLNANQHALLSNIELRTMNEENNSGAELKIIESEVQVGERRITRGDNLIKKINPVTMTGITPKQR